MLTIPDQLSAVHEHATALIREQYQLLNDVLTPAMEATGIRFATPESWTPQQARWMEEHSRKEVEPCSRPWAWTPRVRFRASRTKV